jgi:ATP phosphoribosyltransferase
MTGLVFAVPSKGRLQEQAEAYLADCGLKIVRDARGYEAILPALPEVAVRLISAGDIARALREGEAHLGVTGEDVLREADPALTRSLPLLGLGFGQADLVLAIPQAWVDVESMEDFAAVCAEHRALTGERLRVATKYLNLARRFLDAAHVGDYRLVESQGATEGAPASGAAEAIIDITTSGATLRANHLTRAPGGLILRSQAQLAASLAAPWSEDARIACERLLDVIAARVRARATRLLRLSAGASGVENLTARASALGCSLAGPPEGPLLELYCPADRVLEVCSALQSLFGGAIAVSAPDLIFERPNTAWAALSRQIPPTSTSDGYRPRKDINHSS